MRNLALFFVLMTVSIISVNGQDYARVLGEADSLFKAGDYDKAARTYEGYQVLAGKSGRDVSSQLKKSNDCYTAQLAAKDHLEGKDYEKAARRYSIIINLNPNDSKAKEKYDFCQGEIDKKRAEAKIAVNPRIIGGRDVSFGITGGLALANFNTSASGGLASLMNYGYEAENPSYSSSAGFTVGMLLDIRLEKNLYLQIGANYANVKINNLFEDSFINSLYNSGTTMEVEESTTNTYVEGTAYDKFNEKYNLNYVEVPVLLSYRFKITEKNNFQIFAGPYLGVGIAGKCITIGSTDEPKLTEYNKSDNTPTGKSYYRNYSYNGEMDLFGKTGESTTTNNVTSWSGDYTYDFKESPFKKINAGISFGTAFEFAGLNIGISYDLGLLNIANDDYWSSKRMTIIQYGKAPYDSGLRMKDYKHTLNKFQIKIGYIFRW